MRSAHAALLALLAAAGLPAVASANHPPPNAPAGLDACVALELMGELAQAEIGWYGAAQEIDTAKHAQCDGGGALSTALRWRSGRPALSRGVWYYPTGGVALEADRWYYPSGAVARAGAAWYYPGGQVAFQGGFYGPDGRRVGSLRQVSTGTCGPSDPRCDRYLDRTQRLGEPVHHAASIRFAWQSRPEWSRDPRPTPRVSPLPASHGPPVARPAPRPRPGPVMPATPVVRHDHASHHHVGRDHLGHDHGAAVRARPAPPRDREVIVTGRLAPPSGVRSGVVYRY